MASTTEELYTKSCSLNGEIDYGNKSLNPTEDLKLLLFWIITFAILTPLLQKLILWPIARRAIVEPRAIRKQREIELDGGELAASDDPHVKQRKNLPTKQARDSAESNDLQVSHSKDTQRLQETLSRIEAKRWKFVIAETKLLSYVFFLSFSIWALQDQWSWFWNAPVQHIPFANPPWRLKSLYFMESAHYIYTLFAMYFEPKMKDRAQMTFHHIFTLTLLGSSYYLGTMKYGTSIMVLHDFSDPWMEAAKLFNYVDLEWGANICFVVFALSFVFLRVYIFPRYIISATYNYARPTNYPHYPVTFISLVGLWVLHCIWSCMIWKVFYNSVVLGKKPTDVREEED